MQLSLLLLSGLAATGVIGLAMPSPNPEADIAALEEPRSLLPDLAGASDADIISTSALGLADDANTISRFLDLIYGKKFGSQKAYLKAAKKAYNAAIAESALLEILGSYLDDNWGYHQSNSTLHDGDSYGHSKDLLSELTELNWLTDQAEIQSILEEINYGDGTAQGRCNTILPAFDVIFEEASSLLEDESLEGLKAKTPKSCSAVARRDEVLEA